MFVNVPPMLPTHSLPYQRHFFSKSVIAICRREDKAQYKDIHLSVCVSCLMSGAGSLIYPAMRGRRICMRSMKQQTALLDGACKMQPAGISKKRHRGEMYRSEGIYHCPARILPKSLCAGQAVTVVHRPL